MNEPNTQTNPPQKTVRLIPPKPEFLIEQERLANRQLRTAAYCRVSTDSDEQELSFEAQCEFYTDMIMRNPKWQYVDVFADEGLTGMATKSRSDFNRMIRWCKRGKIDQIITKSVSRFARNTVDSLEHVRLLKSMGIAIIFEKEGFNTLEVTSEFIITIYSSLAQAESESHSGNVSWGKRKSFKRGNVHFSYKSFLGYRQGDDGNPEIDPQEAPTIVRIYREFLSGASREQIAEGLTSDGILTPMRKEKWSASTIHSILKNEKYMGDAILQKTYVADCVSKTVKQNVGQLPQYYVENNHPAIIERNTWNRVQEELARRSGKPKVKEVGTKTEQGKYSGKYVLTELLVCGECGRPYRRVTWSKIGVKKIVWRCINRLDYGKKYCRNSPSLEESVIEEAVAGAVRKLAEMNPSAIETLKVHIRAGLCDGSSEEMDEVDRAQLRLGKIDGLINDLIKLTTKGGDIGKHDSEFEALGKEKLKLRALVDTAAMDETRSKNRKTRIDSIFREVETLKNDTLAFDNRLVRSMVECIRVLSESKLRITFRFGYEVDVAILPSDNRRRR